MAAHVVSFRVHFFLDDRRGEPTEEHLEAALQESLSVMEVLRHVTGIAGGQVKVRVEQEEE